MVYRYAMNMTALGNSWMATAQFWQFADRDQIASWAHSALSWMHWQGIMTGSTATTLNPTGTATRAEAAVMMMRFMEQPVMSLCPELVERIMHDWVETLNLNPPHLEFSFGGFPTTVDDVWIDDYFGTYNGSVALLMNSSTLTFHGHFWGEYVAGYEFRYRSGQRILVWSEGVFYTLASWGGMPGAYELGLLTAEDVGSIYFRSERWQRSRETSYSACLIVEGYKNTKEIGGE